MSIDSKIADKFGRAAEHYDTYADVQKSSSARLAALIKHYADHNFKTIFDIGAGTGQSAAALRHYWPEAEYTLLDISSQMLERAKAKFPDAELIAADAERYAFRRRYDLCISNLSVQWFQNFEMFLQKVLRSCDYFAFSSLLDSSFQAYKSIFERKGIKPPTFQYFDLEQMKRMIKHYHCEVFSSETYHKDFDNALEAARHFRNIGAHHASYQSDQFVTALLSHRAPVSLNYDIFFAVLSARKL